MLKCRALVENADQLLDGAVNRRQRLAMKMHLLMCRHCRRYVRQLGALLRAIPFMHRKASDAEVAEVMDRIYNDQTRRS